MFELSMAAQERTSKRAILDEHDIPTDYDSSSTDYDGSSTDYDSSSTSRSSRVFSTTIGPDDVSVFPEFQWLLVQYRSRLLVSKAKSSSLPSSFPTQVDLTSNKG